MLRAPPPVPHSQLFTLSAYSPAYLELHAAALSDYLKDDDEVNLTDVCGTMALRRSRFNFRKSFVASSATQLAEQLGAFVAKKQARTVEAASDDHSLRVGFVLTGQGSQWAKNGMELMHFPAYRDAVQVGSPRVQPPLTVPSIIADSSLYVTGMQRVDALFSSLSGWSVLDKVQKLSTTEMCDTMYAQPITLLVQVR
jgi:acyl transferase domain-containing protein